MIEVLTSNIKFQNQMRRRRLVGDSGRMRYTGRPKAVSIPQLVHYRAQTHTNSQSFLTRAERRLRTMVAHRLRILNGFVSSGAVGISFIRL